LKVGRISASGSGKRGVGLAAVRLMAAMLRIAFRLTTAFA
jgi:hypothetical protein